MGEGDPQDWKESLSEDLRSHPSLEPYKLAEGEAMVNVPPGLVKSYVGQQALIGRDKIPVPPEGAEFGDESWNEVFSRLGRPETAEGYELKIPEDLPEQVQVSDELITEYKGVAHKWGVHPRAAQEILTWYLGANTKQIESFNAEGEKLKQKTEATLRKDWGLAYDKNIDLAVSTITKFREDLGKEQSQETKDFLQIVHVDGTALGDHPVMIRLFAKIGELIGEDTISGKARPSGVLTPEQAGAEIDKIYGDENHPYHHPKHAGNKAAVEEMDRLTKMQLGEE